MGILRYRGIPIEQLAEKSSFIETAWLIIWGELPSEKQLRQFRDSLTEHELIHEGLHHHFDGFPATAPPMAILSAMINSLSCYHPDVLEMEDPTRLEAAAARLISKVRTIAAAAYCASIGKPLVYPNPNYDYVRNFMHMMFSIPHKNYEAPPEVVQAINLFLLLHADHEQNSSTSTVRMVASSGANLFASCSAGVCALWGWRHGGANVAVIDMLDTLHRDKVDLKLYIERVKKREVRLMGFGHRVYKNYDPRGAHPPGTSRQCSKALERKRSAARHCSKIGRGGTERQLLQGAQSLSERRFLLRDNPTSNWHTGKHVHGYVRDWANARLDCQLERSQRPSGARHCSAQASLHRPRDSRLCAD